MTVKINYFSEDIVPVVSCADDNYAAPLNVMFVSLLENSANPERIHFFVIDGGISLQKKAILTQDIENRYSQITFIDIDKDRCDCFPTSDYISSAAYHRILIPDFLDQKIEKVIYLDCDIIVKKDIIFLWEVDLQEYPLAAVENISNSTYKTSRLQQSDFFNSGVMLLNLKKWRDENISKQVLTFIVENPELICSYDQCALNGVFKGNWKRLPFTWNMQSGLYRNTKQVNRLIKVQTARAIWDPAVIHYMGWSKPWMDPCYHPLEGEFNRYKEACGFMDIAIIRNIPSAAKKRTKIHTYFALMKKRLRKSLWQYRYQKRGHKLYQVSTKTITNNNKTTL